MADGTPEVHAVNGLHRMQSTAPTHRPPRALSPPLPHHRLPPAEIRRLLCAFPGLVAAGAAAHRVYAAAPRYHWRRSLVCTPRPTLSYGRPVRCAVPPRRGQREDHGRPWLLSFGLSGYWRQRVLIMASGAPVKALGLFAQKRKQTTLRHVTGSSRPGIKR
jgi:hypothetical protein